MKKVVVHRPGAYGRLAIESHPEPEPEAGEVRIEVSAAGVNFADCVVRMGLYESAKEYVGWPITPGFEVAGRIAALGEGVTDLEVGDSVLAVTRFGGYSTALCVPRAQVFRRPAALSEAEAAGFAVVHLTAWYALCELVRFRPGMRVLVHSAAGGVGGALLQLARIHDCEVVGVVGGEHKVETARALGASHVIDKSKGDLWPAARSYAPQGYDVILDANGAETLRQSYAHLRPTGRLVAYGFHTMFRRGGRGRPNYLKLAADYLRTPRFHPLHMTNDNKSVMAFNLSYLFDAMEILDEAMDQLLAWLAAGELRMPRITEFAFDDVAAAQRSLESGSTVGKLVLCV